MKKLYFLLLSVLLVAGIAYADTKRVIYVDIAQTNWGNVEKFYVHVNDGNWDNTAKWEATPIAPGSTIYKAEGEYDNFKQMKISRYSNRDEGNFESEQFGIWTKDNGDESYKLLNYATYILKHGENGSKPYWNIYVDIQNTDWGTPEKVYCHVCYNDERNFADYEAFPVQPGSTIYKASIKYGSPYRMTITKEKDNQNVYGDFEYHYDWGGDYGDWRMFSQTLYTLNGSPNGATVARDYVYQGTSCFINYENGLDGGSVTWSHDQAMTKGEDNVWNYSVSTTWESGIQAGVRVYVDEQPAVWYMTMKVNDGADDRYLGGHTDSETMVAEGTEGATNMHLSGPAHWDLTFDADTKVITGTRTYPGYDVRFAHKDNGYNFYHNDYDPIVPTAEGEVTTSEITNLGKDFRLKVWHGDLGVQGMVHGGTIAEADTWVGATVKYQDNEETDGLGTIAVTNPVLRNYVKIVYNIATQQVQVIKTENNTATEAAIGVNVAAKGWKNVTARFYENREATDGESYVDVELEAYTAPASVMAREGVATTPTHKVATTLGFVPKAVAFYETGDDRTITGRSAYDAEWPDSLYGVDDEGAVTGLDSIIASENVAPVYYNMYGVRIEQPTTGMYIVVRNGVATKQIIRF